jgi:hypothetical protein
VTEDGKCEDEVAEVWSWGKEGTACSRPRGRALASALCHYAKSCVLSLYVDECLRRGNHRRVVVSEAIIYIHVEKLFGCIVQVC